MHYNARSDVCALLPIRQRLSSFQCYVQDDQKVRKIQKLFRSSLIVPGDSDDNKGIEPGSDENEKDDEDEQEDEEEDEDEEEKEEEEAEEAEEEEGGKNNTIVRLCGRGGVRVNRKRKRMVQAATEYG